MLRAPDGRHAADVAGIRDWLVEHLSGDVGRALQDWGLLSQMQGMPAPTSVQVELSGLAEAKLFWVPPEETEVISGGATDLPEDLILTEDFLPAPSGFVVFGGNWYGTDAQTGEPSIWPIRAFRWGPVNLPDKCGQDGLGTDDAVWMPGIAISAYSFNHDMQGSALAHFSKEYIQERINKINTEMGLAEAAGMISTEEKDMPPGWMPLGRSDWMIGQHWRKHPVYDVSSISYTSVIEDRCIMSALWALMGACAPIEHVPNRAERRRAERAGRTAAPVRIVTWRGPAGERAATDAELAINRHQSVRYPVKRHWRHQAYGPGRTLRKWILIPTHWRGPEDAPLADAHETIHKVLRRDK